MVRLDPAGTVMVPVALPLVMGMLNTSIVGMSGAVTSATRVATVVPVRFALTPSDPSPPRGPTVFGSAHDTSSNRSPKATTGEVSRLRSIAAHLQLWTFRTTGQGPGLQTGRTADVSSPLRPQRCIRVATVVTSDLQRW